MQRTQVLGYLQHLQHRDPGGSLPPRSGQRIRLQRRCLQAKKGKGIQIRRVSQLRGCTRDFLNTAKSYKALKLQNNNSLAVVIQ